MPRGRVLVLRLPAGRTAGAGPPISHADGLAVVDAARPAAAVADLDLRWVTVTVDGRRGLVDRHPAGGPPRTAAFVASLELSPADGAGAKDLALALVLPCWTLLGMLDRAIDLTREYVLARKQFGQPLSAFQGVQFQLTDAEVERSGLDMLAKYALWSIQAGRREAAADALALRMAAIEAAEIVFRVAHQLHGAMGFCDETHAVLAVPVQPAAAAAAARPVRDPGGADGTTRPARTDGAVQRDSEEP